MNTAYQLAIEYGASRLAVRERADGTGPRSESERSRSDETASGGATQSSRGSN